MLAYHERAEDTSDIWTPGYSASFKDKVHRKRRMAQREDQERRRRQEIERLANIEREKRKAHQKRLEAAKRSASSNFRLAETLRISKACSAASISEVLTEMARRFECTIEDLKGPDRRARFRAARDAAMVALRGLGLSDKQIGKEINRDRTTIRHRLEAIDKQIGQT